MNSSNFKSMQLLKEWPWHCKFGKSLILGWMSLILVSNILYYVNTRFKNGSNMSPVLALFSLPCSTVPGEGFNLSVIIYASLFVFLMLGYRHVLLRHCIISRFSQIESTFSNISTCVHLPVGGHYLALLALTSRYRVVL